MASWSASTELLRVYLAVLSGLGLYLALRAWKGLFPARVLATAGAFLATLWVTLFYGPQAMPNYWVGIGALVAVGCALRVLRVGPGCSSRGALWGVAARRPADGADAAHRRGLGGRTPARLRPRTPPVAVAARAGGSLAARGSGMGDRGVRLVRGLSGSGCPGPPRSRAASAGTSPSTTRCAAWADGACAARAPERCRRPVVTLWWLLLPVVVALAAVVAVRARRATATLLPLACAVAAAAPYLFMIGYAAPRFLQPAYALLAVPVADALWHLVRTGRERWRPVAAALVALAVAGHLAVQFSVLGGGFVDRNVDSREDWARVADELHRLGSARPA
ncbi:Integral membrane protein OS=Streptomyces tendae OX=1932 GN=F3L20_17015 PE=4 SV=1 [Streptomyces tendae]